MVFLSHAGCQPSQAHLDPAVEMKYDYPIIFFPGINVILLACVLILHVLDCIFKVTRINIVWGFIKDGWNNFLDRPIK